jgi:S-DNA-T family DNA segregation ATPase FtsK/SpoIIIE
MVPPEIPRKEPETGAAAPALTPAQAQADLRQVAQEVWKKYGESPALITIDGWRLPPIDILDRAPEIEFGQADNVQRAGLIEEALSSYGVEAKVVQINAGPTVTQFGVEPGWDRKMREMKERDGDGNVRVRQEEVSKTRVKVDRIVSLANDLALALAAPSIRIEAPVPGKSVVGIEVPNTISGVVSLRGVIETSAFQKINARSKLALVLGKGAGGEAMAAGCYRKWQDCLLEFHHLLSFDA